MDTLMTAAELKDRLDARRNRQRTCSWMFAGRSATRTVGRTTLRTTSPGRSSWTSPPNSPDRPIPSRGRHPLPPPEQFQQSARSWGIKNGDVVVAYDDSGNMAAARLWWMLRNAGFRSVYLLDGGLAAWRAAGFDVENGEAAVETGDVTLSDGAMPAIDAGRGSHLGPARPAARRPGGRAVPRRDRTRRSPRRPHSRAP